MSILFSGLLGLAVKFVPKVFGVLAADREQGDVHGDVEAIVRKVAGTENPTEAAKKLDASQELQELLRSQLEELEGLAREEQLAQQQEIELMAQKFLELEEQERKLQNQKKKDFLAAELASRKSARAFAEQAFQSQDGVTAATPIILSVLIFAGFVLTLQKIILSDDMIHNPEIFFTAIGTMATAFATIVAFHFGSSAGSKAKDEFVTSPEAEATEPSRKEVATSRASTANAIPPEAVELKELPDPGGTFGLFRQKVPGIAADLMTDFGMTLDQACGILGNIGHECAGFRTMQEIKPIVPGSRGGWGWCQWTGPRRRSFEAWCTQNGFTNLSDDDANYGFLKHELETTEKRALNHLKETLSLADATRSFMDKFERPGVKHFEQRLNWAREAKRAFRAARG